ncbi:MAG: hypothetical protein U0R64_08220 [Candidatus Nanopelagicales bacterium]
MNRENLPEVVVAVTLGLLFVVAAAYRTAKDPKLGVRRRAAMASLLVYAVVAAPVFVASGMTFWSLLILVVVLALPLVGADLARRHSSDPESAGESAARALVGVGLATVLLISAAETLSLIGRVDPRVVVIALAVIAALVVMGQGLVGGSRAGSLALWLLIVPALISLALGIFLGSVSASVAPIIQVPGLSWTAVVVVALGVFVIGWADNTVRITSAASGPGPWRTWLGAAVVVLVIAFGQLMFLGGAVIALVAVLRAPREPGHRPWIGRGDHRDPHRRLHGLGGSGACRGGRRGAGTGLTGPWVAGVGVVAAAIALFDPGADRVLIVTSLAAAALVGAQIGGRAVGRGVAAGLVTAMIAAVLLAVTSRLELEVAAIAAVVVVLVIAFAAGRTGTADPDPRGSDRQDSTV